MKWKQRGITLIALVITIVVLIILATISINAIIGDNGIIARAEQARDHHENAEIRDHELMQELANTLEDNLDETIKDWDLSKVNKVTSEDGEKVPVPKGYVASTIEGEKSVNTGFVIKEGTNGDAIQGINEFVWVPVRNISDIYDEANNAGQLWNIDTTGTKKIEYPTTQNSGFREPDIVTGSGGSEYDAVSANLQQAGLSSTATATNFKTQLGNEFNSMIESVRRYGGFYIGRYETGDLSKTKAVVQKGNTDIDTQTWYTMYKLGKTIGVNSNVTTSMLWGCQWDATLRWMQNEGTTDAVREYPMFSDSNGNYCNLNIDYVDIDGTTKTTTNGTSTKIPTGSAEITKINNIYDMAGNVEEYTIEAYGNNSRVTRGGSYPSESTTDRVHDRSWFNSSRYYIGSRSTLYISI